MANYTKNMNFEANLLPNTNLEGTLGASTKQWNLYSGKQVTSTYGATLPTSGEEGQIFYKVGGGASNWIVDDSGNYSISKASATQPQFIVSSDNKIYLNGHTSIRNQNSSDNWTWNNTVSPDGDTVLSTLAGTNGQYGLYSNSDGKWLLISADSQDYVTIYKNLYIGDNAKVRIWEDNEGGNIAIISKNGTYMYQMDAYNDNLRLYSSTDNGTSLLKAITFNGETGTFSVPRLSGILDMPYTLDILASTESTFGARFWSGVGAGYTGSTLPGNLQYGTFLTMQRGGNSMVALGVQSGGIFYNWRTENGWLGWQRCKAITDSGTKNGFYYQKYTDGTAECWGTFSYTIAINLSWGNIFSSGGLARQTYPFTWTNKMAEMHTAHSTGYTVICGSNGTNLGTTSVTDSVELFRGTSAPSTTYKVSYYAYGTWA